MSAQPRKPVGVTMDVDSASATAGTSGSGGDLGAERIVDPGRRRADPCRRGERLPQWLDRRIADADAQFDVAECQPGVNSDLDPHDGPEHTCRGVPRVLRRGHSRGPDGELAITRSAGDGDGRGAADDCRTAAQAGNERADVARDGATQSGGGGGEGQHRDGHRLPGQQWLARLQPRRKAGRLRCTAQRSSGGHARPRGQRLEGQRLPHLRPARLLTGAIALSVLAGALAGTVAHAQQGDGSNAGSIVAPGEDGVGAWVGIPGDETDGTGGGPSRSCRFTLDADSDGKPKWPALDPSGEIAYAWFFLSCDGEQVDPAPYLLAVGGAAATPAARTLAEQAFKFLPLPAPEPAFNPPGAAVVGVATWFWTSPESWETRQVQVGVTGLTVRVRATPVTLTWHFGSGLRPLVCRSAGTRYDLSRPPSEQHTDCAYTFVRTSADQPGGTFAAAATTTWRITWRASDGTSGSLPPLLRTTRFRLSVGQVQSLITRSS